MQILRNMNVQKPHYMRNIFFVAKKNILSHVRGWIAVMEKANGKDLLYFFFFFLFLFSLSHSLIHSLYSFLSFLPFLSFVWFLILPLNYRATAHRQWNLIKN